MIPHSLFTHIHLRQQFELYAYQNSAKRMLIDESEEFKFQRELERKVFENRFQLSLQNNEHRNRLQLAHLAQEHALALVEKRAKKMKSTEHVLIKEGMGIQPKDEEELVRIVLYRYPRDHITSSDSNIKFLVGMLSRQRQWVMKF
jgi:hypothetical protein